MEQTTTNKKNGEANTAKNSLDIVITGKKIAVEYEKRFVGKEESKNNDYQYYENLSINSIVGLIKNKQIKTVYIHNNNKSSRFNGFFRETVFKISEASGLGWIQATANQFILIEDKVNPKL